MLTTPYINTDGKCLEIFYFPNGTGYLNLDLIQENLDVKRIATTKNDDDSDSLTTHRSFVSNLYFYSNAPDIRGLRQEASRCRTRGDSEEIHYRGSG